jgi:hypothetical protein
MDNALEKDIRELHYIYTTAKKYSEVYLDNQKSTGMNNKVMNGQEMNGQEMNGQEMNGQDIKQLRQKVIDSAPQGILISELITELHHISDNIRYYFAMLQDKTGQWSNTKLIDANNKMGELNDRYKLKECELHDQMKSIIPKFMSEEQPYPVIITSITSGKDINVLLDVIKYFYLFQQGQLTTKECITHGIEYVEKDGKYPKGLFNSMLI